MSKSILKSKTFWVNVIDGAIALTDHFAGTHILSDQAHTVINIVLNLIMRRISSDPIHIVAPGM